VILYWCGQYTPSNCGSFLSRFLERAKSIIAAFLGQLKLMLLYPSLKDLAFGREMKPEVRKQEFQARAKDIYDRYINGEPCGLNVCWDFHFDGHDDTVNDLPPFDEIVPGSKIIIGDHLLNKLKDDGTIRAGTTLQRVKRIATESTSGRDSYFKDYTDLLHKPEMYNDDSYDFDDVINICQNFHVVQPLIEESCVESCWEMLESSGYSLMPLEDVIQLTRDNAGFMRCNCGTFRHYAWCQHSQAFAFARNIVIACPRTVDPTSTKRKGKQPPGRPTNSKKSRGGGALGRS
jgi:hypothetical protein